MPELDDARSLELIDAGTLAADDVFSFFSGSRNRVVGMTGTALQNIPEASVLAAVGDGEFRIYSGFMEDALASMGQAVMQSADVDYTQFTVTEPSGRYGTIDSVNMDDAYVGADPTVTLVGYLGYGNDALIVGLATHSQMAVTGTIEGVPAGPLTCPNLLIVDETPGVRTYRDPAESANYCIGSATTGWQFGIADPTYTYLWVSDALVDTPDLVPAGAYDPDTNPDAWRSADDDCDGLPIFTPALPVAQHVVDAINASPYAMAVLVGDGTGTVTTEEVQTVRNKVAIVPPYVDDAAATTGGLAAYELYFNTTTGQFKVVAP